MIRTEKNKSKKVIPDSRGRFALGEFIRADVDGYKVESTAGGVIILTPYAEVPLSEPWLDDYPDKKESFLKGLDESKRGKVGPRGLTKEFFWVR